MKTKAASTPRTSLASALFPTRSSASWRSELCGIVQKTVGLAEPLCDVLLQFADSIAAAFVFGSLAKRSDTAGRKLPLLIRL